MISVVMPVYNSEKYVELAIKSILNQTYTKFEFLIFDDFSTDDSISIINFYKKLDKRIKVFTFKKKMGLTKLLNYSLSLVKFKYVARMDSDDISQKDRLKLQFNYLLKNPKVGLVGSYVNIIDKMGYIKKKWKYPTKNFQIRQHLAFESCVAHPSVMFKVDLVRKVGGYREVTNLVEDYDLWTRLSCVCEIQNLPLFLLNYREHSESSSFKKKKEQLLKKEFIKMNYKLIQNNKDYIKLYNIKKLNEKVIFKILGNKMSKEYYYNLIKLKNKKKIICLFLSIIFLIKNPIFATKKIILFIKRGFY